MVIITPFALETLRVTGAIPKFRFLQMDRLGPGVQCPLDANAQEFAIVGAGRHVIHIATMADFVPGAIRLRLVFVVDAVETSVEIILIFAPGDAGHDVNPITMIAPGLNAGG
jgi:hypothetical protein